MPESEKLTRADFTMSFPLYAQPRVFNGQCYVGDPPYILIVGKARRRLLARAIRTFGLGIESQV